MIPATLRMVDVWHIFSQGTEQVAVLAGISQTFEQCSYAITGVSGSGKSTLLHLLAGLEEPTRGAVLYNDHNMTQFSAMQRQIFLESTVGLMFQLPYLIEELCVSDNVMLKGYIAGQPTVAMQERARELLAAVGLAHKAQDVPSSLSGGEQQRVACARALFLRPQFLLADEPTAHLDAHAKRLMLDLFCRMQKEYGMGLIIATHDEEVASMMDRRLVLHNGQCQMIR